MLDFSSDIRALKLLMDIFRGTETLITFLFYDNDLKVLCGILCQDLIDTNQAEVVFPFSFLIALFLIVYSKHIFR